MAQNQCSNDTFTYTHTSAGQAMFRMIAYTDKKDLSLIEVMGYSSLAFRINIHAETVDIAGPYASFNWGDVFRRSMMNLGFNCRAIGAPNFTPPSPEELQEALHFTQSCIDRGLPVMAWDLFVPEFGVIYGYDDQQQQLTCLDTAQDGVLPYVKLGRGRIGELFLMGIVDSFAVDETHAWRDALEMILEHAFEHQPRHDQEPYRNGLAGYEAWMQALRSQSVEVVGNAYNALVVGDARAYAAAFLTRLAEKWRGGSPLQQEVAPNAQAAATCYHEVARHLGDIRTHFPFPQGGTPNDPATARAAIDLLGQARAAEAQGIEHLQAMYHRLSREG